MVNKIVQLTDDEGNNIYPVTNAPQITMTNVDPGEGSSLAENHFVGVYGGDPIVMDYSTNEINTGAKWIDGSPIYRKTYTGTVSVTANQRQNITLESAATCEVDALVRVGGYMTYGTGSYGKNIIPYSETNSSGTPTEWCMVYVVADTGELRAVRWSSNNRSDLQYVIWVEYTKRT